MRINCINCDKRTDDFCGVCCKCHECCVEEVETEREKVFIDIKSKSGKTVKIPVTKIIRKKRVFGK